MTKLICKKIDETDYYYFGANSEHLLFTIHCDDMDYFVGADAYNDICRATENGEEVTLTIAVSVQPTK